MDGYLAATEATNGLIIYTDIDTDMHIRVWFKKKIAINTKNIRAKLVCLSFHLQRQVESLLRAAKL